MHGYFFGYGSLVNRKTHDYAEAGPARLPGWRRVWRHTATRPVAYLTAIPDPHCEIDGLVARVGADEWPDLDHRERAYDRVLTTGITHSLPHMPDVQIYTIPDGKHAPATATNPVLLSYLDTVAQGFLMEFGREGVSHFFSTTSGWDAPIAADRHAPIYGRHQTLTAAERALVDEHLEALGCVLVDPPKL